MSEVTINKFLKGVVSDLDPTNVPNDHWVFPTSGIRIINVPGKGFVATMADGTEQILILSNIDIGTDLYSPFIIGATEYKGIIYLVIAYEGESLTIIEVGSFGSPKQAYLTNSITNHYLIASHERGFSNSYKPLITLASQNGIGRYSLRTIHFGYTKSSVVQVIRKESYDGSLDLYLCDGVNPNYVINTGFDQSGIFTERTLNKTSFDSGELFKKDLVQIRGVTEYPTPEEVNQSSDGYLKAGNYFFFLRYVTESLDRTGFISEIGPIQVGRGSRLHDLEGGGADYHTSRSVTLRVPNHDQNYTYVEVAFARYYGEIGFSSFETFLISKKYDTANQSIVVTGYEQLEPINLGEIVRPNIQEKTSKVHIQYRNRYIGGNWISDGYNRISLASLFLKIKPMQNNMYKYMDDPDHWDYARSEKDDHIYYYDLKLRYKDYQNTYEYAGYFRGEIYPFAGIAVLDDGTITEAFPITGAQFSTGGWIDHNDFGIIKFPDYGQGAKSFDQTQILGLQLDLANFLTEIKSNPAYSKIRGFYIVRGERISNLIFQGLMVPAASGKKEEGKEEIYAPFVYLGSDDEAPLVIKSKDEHDVDPDNDYYYNDRAGIKEPSIAYSNRAAALFVPDQLFSVSGLTEASQRLYLKSVYTVGINTGVTIHPNKREDVRPAMMLVDIRRQNSHSSSLYKNEVRASVIQDAVREVSYASIKWGSFFERGDYINFKAAITTGQFPTKRRAWNRKMTFPRYIGIWTDGDKQHNLNNGWFEIANIYRSDPAPLYDTFKTSFSVQSTNYHKISDFIDVDTNDNEITLFGGDCFMQRTAFRALYWKDYSDQQFDDWERLKEVSSGDNEIKYAHGTILSFITENVVNVAMRDDDQGNETYYPKSNANQIWHWLYEENDQNINEAFYYNPGYHQTLSFISHRGYDITIPYYENRMITRVRYSAKAIPGQLYDSWRIFDIIGYEDYNVAYGAINGLFEHMGVLGSIQERAINRHFTDDKELRLPTNQADIVLGTTKFLSENVVRIAEYGSQHVLAMVNGSKGVYGVDYKQQVLWVVKTQMSDYGQLHLNAMNLAEGTFIQTEFQSLISNLNTVEEDVYNDKGILVGYDGKNKEIHFSILGNDKVLAYSETLDQFIGMHPYIANRYIQGDNELISIPKSGNVLYRHLQEGDGRMQWHGQQATGFTLSWVVAGKEGMETMIKMFEFMSVEAMDNPFSKLKLKTDYQHGTHDFINQIQIEPGAEYAENIWEVPLPLAEAANGQFEEQSQYHGTYLIVTLIYENSTKQFIRNVKTHFNLSYV